MADYADGPEAAMAKICALKPRKPPGTSFTYSDVGYIVLGEVVHAVDGRTLDRFAREEVFVPAGMTETMYLPDQPLKVRKYAPTQVPQRPLDGGGSTRPAHLRARRICRPRRGIQHRVTRPLPVLPDDPARPD